MDGRKSTMLRVMTNSVAFVVLIVIAVLLVVAKCTTQIPNISLVCLNISRYLAYVLVALASLWYALSKRNSTTKIVWTICVATIIVLAFI
jgi:hypothetical protein